MEEGLFGGLVCEGSTVAKSFSLVRDDEMDDCSDNLFEKEKIDS